MMQILSLGDYYAGIDEDKPDQVPSLREQLAEICTERPRRIDRFTELSLLGAGLCVANLPAGVALDDATALYISSGLASMSNVVKVQQQIFVQGEPPKPAGFINTLSNSAGYHVAKNIGLHGKNIFVSRHNSSFEAILQLAALDFATGTSRGALLGAVDESPAPLAHQRTRMRLPDGAPLAEGSHWFFVRPETQAQDPANAATPLASISVPQTLRNTAALASWLDSQALANTAVHLERDAALAVKNSGLLPGVPRFEPPLGHYGARSAGVVSRFIEAGNYDCLINVTGDKMGRLHVMRIERTRHSIKIV